MFRGNGDKIDGVAERPTYLNVVRKSRVIQGRADLNYAVVLIYAHN